MTDESTTGEPRSGYAPQIPEGRLDLRCARALRQIIRSVDIYSHRLATEHAVTVPQLTALSQLVEHGPMMLKRLAMEMYLSPSTTVGIVDRLEAKGLVVRKRSAKDRRQVLLYPTDDGQALVRKTPSPLQSALSVALADLGDLERTTILLSLERVVELLDVSHLDASPILETGIELEPQGSNHQDADDG